MKSMLVMGLLLLTQQAWAGYKYHDESMNTKPMFGAAALFLFGVTRVMQQRQREVKEHQGK